MTAFVISFGTTRFHWNLFGETSKFLIKLRAETLVPVLTIFSLISLTDSIQKSLKAWGEILTLSLGCCTPFYVMSQAALHLLLLPLILFILYSSLALETAFLYSLLMHLSRRLSVTEGESRIVLPTVYLTFLFSCWPCLM